MRKIPVLANPVVYKVVDFTAEQYLSACDGKMGLARALLLNILIRPHIFRELLYAFGDEKIVRLAMRTLETSYDFYVKYLKAIRGEEGYELCYGEDGKALAIRCDEGWVVPGRLEIVSDFEIDADLVEIRQREQPTEGTERTELSGIAFVETA
jgi:hypothetical protein